MTDHVLLTEIKRREAKAAASQRPKLGKVVEVSAEAELAGALKALGHSDAGALVAARGRGGRRDAVGLVEAGLALGLSPAAARTFAAGRGIPEGATDLVEAGRRLGMTEARARIFARGRGGIREAVTKTEPASGDFKGGDFGKADYAYAPSDDPAGWALLLTLSPGGPPDPDLVRGAVAAIDPQNPADNPVPEEALPAVKATLTSAWATAGLSAEPLPAVLQQEELRASFRRLGLSERAANIAADGRGRRSRA